MSETEKTKALAVASSKDELVSMVAKTWGRSEDEVNAMVSVSFPTLKTLGQLTVAFGIANKYDLDPMVKEMYAYIDHRENLTTIVGKDGFMKIARKQKGYVSLHSVAVYAGDEFEMDFAEMKVLKHRMGGQSMSARSGNPIGAYAVLRMEGKPDVINWVDWNEYAGSSGPWTKQKAAMIRKCAVAVLCREAFGLSGLYDEAEILDANEIGLTISAVDPKLAAPADRFKRPEASVAEPARTAPIAEAEIVETEEDPEPAKEAEKPKRKVSTAKNLREANDEIAKDIALDPQFQEVFGAQKAEATKEPEAPGKDQLARIRQICADIESASSTDIECPEPKDRAEAAKMIRELSEYLEGIRKETESDKSAQTAPATAEEAVDVFAEEEAEDLKTRYLAFYAEYDEEGIREAGKDAKKRFMEAKELVREKPTDVNREGLTEVTAEYAAIVQIFTERNYVK